jgi:hypothetical protein
MEQEKHFTAAPTPQSAAGSGRPGRELFPATGPNLPKSMNLPAAAGAPADGFFVPLRRAPPPPGLFTNLHFASE